MYKMKRSLLITISYLLLLQTVVMSQSAYEHVSNTNLYTFIDELAALHLIEVNTSIKPYSRSQIAAWLKEAEANQEQLSKVQRARLKVHLQEYLLESGSLKTGGARLYQKDEQLSVHLLPPEVVWRDTLFRAILRPIYGIRYFSFEAGNFYHSYGGAEAIAYIGKNWSVYASLRDNYQNKEVLALPSYLTLEPGGNYKINEGGRKGGDYSEMRGGITYSWNWGSVGLLKDHIQWGDNENGSNILSGRTPSFPVIKLHMNPVHWLEFNYFHGWLVSQVIDSANSYTTLGGSFRAKYRNKYIASNMYTFKPFKSLHFSVGNAIIYSDMNAHPAYMIPFFFFKSLDHTINRGIENQNSMMFVNISSRQVKHLHLYASVFIDEFSKTRISDPDRHNFISYKAGASLTGWPLKNLGLTGEFTMNYPNTFEHHIETTTFETNKFNLGHYLGGNSKEFFGSVRYSPVGSLQLTIDFLCAMHGNDYPYDHNLPFPADELPVLEEKSWDRKGITFRAEMLPLPNTRVFAEYTFSNINGYDLDGNTAQFYLNKFTPSYQHGKTHGLVVGFGIGF